MRRGHRKTNRGYSPNKVPALELMIHVMGWKTAVVIGWQHATMFLDLQRVYAIDCDASVLIPLLKHDNAIAILRDGLLPSTADYIVEVNPDVLFIDLLGGDEDIQIAERFLNTKMDIVAICCNRHIGKWKAMGFKEFNVKPQGKGAVYLVVRKRGESDGSAV